MAIGRQAEDTANTTATAQNSSFFNNAQNSYANAQTDAGNFENQLSKYSAANPYGQGGQAQTTTNQQLSNTAGSSAASAGQDLQAQALRTGGNTQGAIAATEQMQEGNERGLGADEAKANASRIGNQASYNQSVLNATAQPVSQQTALSGQQGNLATGAAGNAIKAGETPTFGDEFGNAFGQALGKGLGAGVGGAGMAALCWIAAELFGGWLDPRTIAVRGWLLGDFSRTLAGRVLLPLYRTFGERVAELVRRYKPVRAIFQPIFDAALRKATEARG